MLGLSETDGGLAVLPLATLFEQLDALETLEDGTLAADFGVVLEAVVLGHGFGEVEGLCERRNRLAGAGN